MFSQDSSNSFSVKPLNQSSLFIANASYRMKANKSPLHSGRGLGFELGLNLGYFVSQKLLIAPFIGYGFRDAILNTSYSDEYIDDLSNSYDPSILNRTDKLAVDRLVSFIKNGDDFHETVDYYGLMIRLPFRYSPIIKIYTGNVSQLYKTFDQLALDTTISSNGKYDHDYLSIDSKMKWGAEFFLYNGVSKSFQYDYLNTMIKEKDLNFSLNIIALSVYFEQIDNSNASFYFTNGPENVRVPLKNVMSQSFMDKYRKDVNFGFRLSCGMF